MSSNGPYTPTQRAILTVLADGRSHHHSQLQRCLPDDLADGNALRQHIFKLRRKLRPKGHLIICELVEGQAHYCLRRRIGSYGE